ncbi:alcohol dehydrogenase [Wolfiporia cocos MD-104 SS10]|uniref:Alcohol dehydrogenase n=1 Tax=Wolfiporia cocos (strain MD-104) TaxID=742152 RepID=A0A2H3JG66_WOLCO|nr:alcohol dehydrogenase [Wolfiporia cocos MD-104 SS10]
MAPISNGRLFFNEIPTGLPEPGKTTVYDTSETIDLDETSLGGGFLVKTLVLSIDPYQRGKMRDPNEQSYSAPYIIGEPLYNYGVGVVLRSEHPGIKPGTHLYGTMPFQQYFIRNESEKFTVLQDRIVGDEHNLPWSAYVGVCGMPGQTAYHGWKEFSKAKQGEIAFVTAGAGPVGSMVIQLAKRDGLKVIASAGSEDKVAFLRKIGTDVAFNYKTEKTLDVLQKEGPIDVFWDGVGGETLEAAIEAAARGARFIECGMISAYNGGVPYHVKNLTYIMSKELKISGFVVSSLHAKYLDEFYRQIPPMVARGELLYTEDIASGLENAGQAILDVQTGRNKGKSVVVVAQD